MQDNYHFMSILVDERIEARFKEAGTYRLAHLGTTSKSYLQPLLTNSRRILVVITDAFGFGRSAAQDNLDQEIVGVTR